MSTLHSLKHRQSLLRTMVPVFGVLAIGLFLTTMAWLFESRSVKDNNQILFDKITDNIEEDTIEVMQRHVQALRGGAGFFHASETITPQAWTQYVTDLDFAADFPGIQGMSLNRYLRGQGEKSDFLREIQSLGLDDFTVKPAGVRDIYVPVVYLDPATVMNRRAVGFDIYSEPNRRAAVNLAIDTGRAAMTAKIILVQENPETNVATQNGVLLIQPVFDLTMPTATADERRTAVQGFIVAAFRMGDLMNYVLQAGDKDEDGLISVRLYDASTPTPEALLFENSTAIPAAFGSTRTFDLYGRSWTLKTSAPATFNRMGSTQSPFIVAIAGILLSLMMTAFAWQQVQRARDSELAAIKTHENNLHVKSLMHEVNHRSKNLLSVVRAIARLTSKSDTKDFLTHFSQRIEALSASQDLLVRSAWKGTQMRDLVSSQLAHFDDVVGARVFAHGPDVQLQAAAAQTIGMALHELATNAGKYGALSNQDGRVTISWQICNADDGAQLRISWIESGGPTVSPDITPGFGSVVTGRMAEHGLQGTAQTVYAPTGLEWHYACLAKAAQEPRPDPITAT